MTKNEYLSTAQQPPWYIIFRGTALVQMRAHSDTWSKPYGDNRATVPELRTHAE